MNKQELLVTLKGDEGFKAKAYWDVSQWTYGYGCRAPSKDAVITEPYASGLLSKRVGQAIREFYEIFGDQEMSETRQHALVNMIFNMGIGGVLEFKNMIAAIRVNDWDKAADEAMDSEWYRKDVPRWRSDRIVKELREG